MENFSELNLNESLKHSIARMHFKIPTPIQVQAIPPALLVKDWKLERELGPTLNKAPQGAKETP